MIRPLRHFYNVLPYLIGFPRLRQLAAEAMLNHENGLRASGQKHSACGTP